jgi:hypothetical protein
MNKRLTIFPGGRLVQRCTMSNRSTRRQACTLEKTVMVFVLAVMAQFATGQVREAQAFGNYREQMHMQTDRSWYLAGETLWCSLFLTDAHTNLPSQVSRVAYLELLDPAGKPAWQAMVRIDSGRGQASWKIPSTLPSAGYTLRSYTRWMRNQPVETFFQAPLLLINPQKKPVAGFEDGLPLKQPSVVHPHAAMPSGAGTLSVQADADKYGTRKAVNVTVQARDLAGKPVGTTFSASVTRIGDTTNAPMALQMPSANGAGFDAGKPSSTVPSQQNKPAGRPHIPELAGPVAAVLVQHRQTGKPVSGILVSLSVPGTRFQTMISRSNKDGMALFPLDQQEGSGVLAYAFLDQSRDSLLLAPLPLFDPRVAVIKPEPGSSPAALMEEINAQLTDIQLAQAFRQDAPGPMRIRESSDTTVFFGKADKQYFLDDYVRFSTLEEVFREYVREVEVRKAKSDYKLRVLNAPLRSFFEDDPLVLLDGVPIRDIGRVMSFDPLKIRSIEIVAHRFYLGGQGFPGILVLRTYQGDLGGIDLPEDILITEYAGLLPAYDFTAPDYSGQADMRLPDLRRTLYWAPIMRSRSEEPARLHFYTGDLPGRYRVTIHALTADGRLLSATIHFDVR